MDWVFWLFLLFWGMSGVGCFEFGSIVKILSCFFSVEKVVKRRV